jgi:very-short-patch-repair endonuclease
VGPDRAIARLARRQHGIVTRGQLQAIGLGRGSIEHRIAQGRLHRLHRGVYLVDHPVLPPLARECAAVLACGEGAVLSHFTAAWLWGVLPSAANGVDVTVPGDRRDHSDIRIHRTGRLERADVARRHGLPLTAPPRTLVDLGGVLSAEQLERCVAEAFVLRRVTRRQMDGVAERSDGRTGIGTLRALLADGPALTRSEAEARLLALVRAARLPPPAGNVRIGPHEVDFLWREERFVVEVDGYAYHSTRRAFERDRRRDAELHANGFDVVRVTWRQIVDEPEALVARLAQRLSSGKWR